MKRTRLSRRLVGCSAGPALLLALLLVASFLTACTAQPEAEQSRLRVAVTIPPLADFVEQVGGGLVQVTVMVPAGASPHTHEPTPGQMSDIAHADAYFKVGSGVEFELVWLDNLVAQNPEMTVVDCSEGIELIDNDPHIWNSPVNAATMTRNIVQGLATVAPEHADAFESNGTAYVDELMTLHAEIEDVFAGAQTRYFLVYHSSFAYFAREYGLVQLAIEEEGKDTTPQTLRRTIDLAQEHRLHYVFVEPQFATAEAESIADTLGAEVATIDPLPRTYIPATRSTAEAIGLEIE